MLHVVTACSLGLGQTQLSQDAKDGISSQQPEHIDKWHPVYHRMYNSMYGVLKGNNQER